MYVHADTAEIYLSMQDLTGERIDETVDLFDSYSIHSSRDSSSTCSLIEFDPESGKAVFLVQVKHMNGEKIEGQKLTFSVSEFLTGKQRVEQELPEIDLSRMEEKTELQTNVTRREMCIRDSAYPSSLTLRIYSTDCPIPNPYGNRVYYDLPVKEGCELTGVRGIPEYEIPVRENAE